MKRLITASIVVLIFIVGHLGVEMVKLKNDFRILSENVDCSLTVCLNHVRVEPKHRLKGIIKKRVK